MFVPIIYVLLYMSNKNYCAPGFDGDNISCFTLKSLKNIAQNWNNEHPENKIKISNSKRILWHDIFKKLRKSINCPDELCWLDSKYTEEIDIEHFKPIIPYEWNKNKTMWLNTMDIANVLNQYHKKYKDFQFIGPVPIDFNSPLGDTGICVVEEMCKINIGKLFKNGKRKIGIVFNLDPHNEKGSHWVSMFINLNNGGIYYFDSYGLEPKEEIKNFMKRVHKQGNMCLLNNVINYNEFENVNVDLLPIDVLDEKTIKVNSKIAKIFYENDLISFVSSNKKCEKNKMCKKTKELNMIDFIDYSSNIIYLQNKLKDSSYNFAVNKGFKFFINKKRHQYKNSECGVYSIYFIVQLLSGKEFKEVVNSHLPDEKMEKYRYELYRPNFGRKNSMWKGF